MKSRMEFFESWSRIRTPRLQQSRARSRISRYDALGYDSFFDPDSFFFFDFEVVVDFVDDLIPGKFVVRDDDAGRVG